MVTASQAATLLAAQQQHDAADEAADAAAELGVQMQVDGTADDEEVVVTQLDGMGDGDDDNGDDGDAEQQPAIGEIRRWILACIHCKGFSFLSSVVQANEQGQYSGGFLCFCFLIFHMKERGLEPF